MKIAFNAMAMDLRSAGVGRYSYQLAKAILDLDDPDIILHPWHHTMQVYLEEKGLKDIQIHSRNRATPIGYWHYNSLPGRLRKEGYDIIHDPCQPGMFTRSTGAANILTIHDLSPITHPKTHRWQTVRKHKSKLGKNLENCHGVICVSQATADDLHQLYRYPYEKIHVVHNGVGGEFTPGGLMEREDGLSGKLHYLRKVGMTRYLLCVATFEPRKSIDLLVKAFSRVSWEITDLSLVLVGNRGWKYKKIDKTIKDHQILHQRPDIKICRDVGDLDLIELYRHASLFTFVSKKEGFGLPVLEAMACGTPCLISNDPALKEVAGGVAEVSDILDDKLTEKEKIELLANSMKNLLKDEKKTNLMRKKGLKRAKEFSWERAARETVRVYRKLM